MSWKLICHICPILLCASSYALVESKIDEKKPISIPFSKSSHNRISVCSGYVEKIFGDDTYFNISIDRMTGNAFVNVLRDIEEPITLTVVTNTGLIQDLLITSADKPSEHLILKDEEEDPIETTMSFHENTIEFLNQILEGHLPLGYGLRASLDKDTLQLPHPLMATTIRAFESPFEEVIVYSIKNTGKDPIVINAKSLKKDNASWVFFTAHELKSKEQTVCIISFQKNEN